MVDAYMQIRIYNLDDEWRATGSVVHQGPNDDLLRGLDLITVTPGDVWARTTCDRSHQT